MRVAGVLLADARFPGGGHAHSGGLEPAATAGAVTDLATLEVFLRGRLRTAGLVGFVDDGSTLGRAATVMMSGAWPPPAPSVW